MEEVNEKMKKIVMMSIKEDKKGIVKGGDSYEEKHDHEKRKI